MKLIYIDRPTEELNEFAARRSVSIQYRSSILVRLVLVEIDVQIIAVVAN